MMNFKYFLRKLRDNSQNLGHLQSLQKFPRNFGTYCDRSATTKCNRFVAATTSRSACSSFRACWLSRVKLKFVEVSWFFKTMLITMRCSRLQGRLLSPTSAILCLLLFCRGFAWQLILMSSKFKRALKVRTSNCK
jgi:hypothetical protein